MASPPRPSNPTWVDEARPAWRRLSPFAEWRDPTLEAIEAELLRPETEAELFRLDEEQVYPHGLIERLYHAGLSRLLTEDDPVEQSSSMTPHHLYALNSILGRHSCTLAITVGVNFLASLPLWIAGTPEQIRRAFRQIRGGKFLSMLITEIEVGSDILRTRLKATRGTLGAEGIFQETPPGAPHTHYRLDGQKDLINGARLHDLLVTFARTRARSAAPADTSEEQGGRFGALRDFSFFLVSRDRTLTSPRRWPTLPAQGADISSIRFERTVVHGSTVLGREGGGFDLLQKTLAMSRGGVGAIASGMVSDARHRALGHARRRLLYGAPIAALGPVADHLSHLEALDLLVGALATKAAVMVNGLGPRAGHFTAVAKFACSTLGEEAVREGARVLSARALLREEPYSRHLRDAGLYGVFEGTTHVMLDRIQGRLAQVAVSAESLSSELADLAALYALAPRRVLEICRESSRSYLSHPIAHARALAALAGERPLAPLQTIATALIETVRHLRAEEVWGGDPGLRAQAGEAFAYLETLFALVELADPDRRRGLGLPAVAAPPDDHALVYQYGLGWFGARLAGELRLLALRAGLPSAASSLADAQAEFLAGHEPLRRRMHDRLTG